MITSNMWVGGAGYANGAEKSTLNQPLYSGDVDKIDTNFPTKIRKQNKWLNVNGTDIPTVIASYTARTIGISVSTQVESKSETFNQQAEDTIDYHNKIGVGELTNKHHFNSAMRAVSDFDLLDGGIMVCHHCSLKNYKLGKWKYPYRYELVSVDMIDYNIHDVVNNKDEITVAGIVLNKWNQQTHLWIYADHNKTTSKKVPIDSITYYSDVWTSVGQQVAISRLSSMLSTLDKIYQYSNAELASAIEEAKAGAYIKSTAFNEIMQIAIEKIKVSGTPKEKVSEIQEILKGLAGIGIGTTGLTPIPSGDDVIFNNSKRDSVFNDLNNNSEMKMASSVGMSGLGIYRKADKANYSALKYVAETDQLSANIRWDNISNKIVNEINTRIIRIGVQIGQIAERVKYFAKPELFNKFRYLRRNKIDIEPGKTAVANEKNLKNGLTTEAEIIEETKGIKYEKFLEKKFAQNKLALSYQLKLEKLEKDERENLGLELEETEEQKVKKEKDTKEKKALSYENEFKDEVKARENLYKFIQETDIE